MSRFDGILDLPLAIKRNGRFHHVVTVKDKFTKQVRDLTGYSARMQIRQTRAPTGTLLGTLVSPPSAGTGIDMASSNSGVIVIMIDDAVTGAYTWEYGFYDLAIIDASGNPEFIMQGDVSVTQNVTTFT